MKEFICKGISERSSSDVTGQAILYLNDKYQVIKRQHTARDGQEFVHLSIKRIDREPIHDWRDLQSIKNQIVGKENEAVEIYPAESRLVDTANQYHLWVDNDSKYRFPMGFYCRLTATPEDAKELGAVQRSFSE